MSKKKITQIIFITLLFVNSPSAHCFNVSTNRIEISVPPSVVYEGDITVTNTEKKELEFKLRTENWFAAGQGLAEEKTNVSKWLKISPLEFELRANEAKKTHFTVTIPRDTRGELSAMIFIDGKPKMTTEAAVGINTSIGIPIYAMIKGTERFKASVEDLEVKNNSPLELNIKIKNSGNVHIRPDGVISIKTKGGKKLFTVPLNEYHYPILPDSSRVLEVKSRERRDKGEYTADIKMGYIGRKYSKKVAVILK